MTNESVGNHNSCPDCERAKKEIETKRSMLWRDWLDKRSDIKRYIPSQILVKTEHDKHTRFKLEQG